MDTQQQNSEKIISRLKFFGYYWESKGTILKVSLPMLCYLKIKIGEDKIKITSHISFGFRILPIEINFVIYGFILYALTWFQWTNLNKGYFDLLGIMMIYFVVCFIKLESFRSVINSSIHTDSDS